MPEGLSHCLMITFDQAHMPSMILGAERKASVVGRESIERVRKHSHVLDFPKSWRWPRSSDLSRGVRSAIVGCIAIAAEPRPAKTLESSSEVDRVVLISSSSRVRVIVRFLRVCFM